MAVAKEVYNNTKTGFIRNMKLKFFISLLVMISSYQTFGQNCNHKNIEEMEKFDINILKGKNLLIGETYKVETGDALIEYRLTDEFYFVRTKMKASPFTYEKTYYKNSKLLRLEREFFRNLRLLTKMYDESGRLIFDEYVLEKHNITLSIDDLITILKDEYNIDLTNKENGQVKVESNPPSYIIRIKVPNKWEWRIITIDGKSGKIISNKMEYPTG